MKCTKGKSSIVFILAFLTLGVRAVSYSEDIKVAPHFYYYGCEGQNSVLSMQCNGDPPFNEITCDFTQIMLRKMDEKERRIREEDAVDSAYKMKTEDIRKLKKDLPSKHDMEKIIAETNLTNEQRAALNKYLSIASLNIKTHEDLKKFVLKQIEHEFRTCKINHFDFQATFKRISKNKWLSNPGPQGLCNVVTVITLENNPEHSGLWKYSQVKASADTNNKLCEGIELNRPFTCSYQVSSEYCFDCDTISFGF